MRNADLPPWFVGPASLPGWEAPAIMPARAAAAMGAEQAAAVVEFLRSAGRLKKVKRAGWVRRDVPEVESVADHTFRVALAAMAAGSVVRSNASADDGAAPFDVARAVGIAVVHDLAEAVVGDITPHDGVSKEEKRRLESGAIEGMRHKLDAGQCGTAGDEVAKLWLEYEEGSTPEARLVKDLDKVEMAIQALEYQNENRDIDLANFQASAEGAVKTDAGRTLVAAVAARRAEELAPPREP